MSRFNSSWGSDPKHSCSMEVWPHQPPLRGSVDQQPLAHLLRPHHLHSQLRSSNPRPALGSSPERAKARDPRHAG